MLIEFRVANHRSLREEQVLSLETGEHSAPAHRAFGGVLPCAAVYGANASGKSNVFGALAFMREAVVYSHRIWAPDAGVPRDPFAWSGADQEPSLYEATFLIDDVRYDYGFSVNDDAVLEEWLHAWPAKRKQVWFQRDESTFKFGEHLHGENRLIEKVTRPNSLFLSTAAQNRHDQLTPIFRWFSSWSTRHARQRSRRFSTSAAAAVFEEDRLLRRLLSEAESTPNRVRLRELLRAADVGVLDVKINQDDDEGRAVRPRVLLRHQSSDDDAWLPLAEESEGTQKLMRIAPAMLRALDRGSLFLVDELEASFHPLLAIRVVGIFNNPMMNANRAQLVFSTHDTNLLGTTAGVPTLSRQQIWFTEKDGTGSTRLYPLSDFRPRRTENIERGYLQGRYGAVPFLGDLYRASSEDELG